MTGHPPHEPVDAVLGIGRYAKPAAPDDAGGPLLSIGVFARRSRLSLKALRLYDRLGVLTPAHVDPANGYRRYHVSQLATARLVVMLRRLDMPLGQVIDVGIYEAVFRQLDELAAAYGMFGKIREREGAGSFVAVSGSAG